VEIVKYRDETYENSYNFASNNSLSNLDVLGLKASCAKSVSFTGFVKAARMSGTLFHSAGPTKRKPTALMRCTDCEFTGTVYGRNKQGQIWSATITKHGSACGCLYYPKVTKLN